MLGVASFGDGLTVTSGNVVPSSTVLRLSTTDTTTHTQTKTSISTSGAWDGGNGNILTMTLSAPITLSNGTNLIPGAYYHFIISGAYTITYGSQFKWKSGATTQPMGLYSVLSCYAIDANTLDCIMQPNFV